MWVKPESYVGVKLLKGFEDRAKNSGFDSVGY